METTRLGNTKLETAPVVMGGNVFGWTIDEKQSFELLDEFVGAGFNTVDTADVYSRWGEGNSGGESESIIGSWMKKRGIRKEVNVITKVGSDVGQGHKDITEKHIVKAVDDSLRRLQTDHIDLYLTHWDDDRTPVEETLGAYQKLIDAGKVRYIGASNLSPERLNASLEASKNDSLPRYEVFQPGYNLCDRKDFEKGVASICQSEGLGVITYFSLAKGFLTGKYRTEDDLGKSVRGQGVLAYYDQRGMKILEALDDISSTYKVSPAGVALAWLIHKETVNAPITSATKSKHMQAFIEVAELVLTPTDMEQLDAASAY